MSFSSMRSSSTMASTKSRRFLRRHFLTAPQPGQLLLQIPLLPGVLGLAEVAPREELAEVRQRDLQALALRRRIDARGFDRGGDDLSHLRLPPVREAESAP